MALTESDLKGTSSYYCSKCKQIKKILKDIYMADGMCTDCVGYKKTPISTILKKNVYTRDFGSLNNNGKCPCCDRIIDSKNFAACHVVAERLGGKTELINLVAGCNQCNQEMGMINFYEFMHAKRNGIKPQRPTRTYLMEITKPCSALLPDTEMMECYFFLLMYDVKKIEYIRYINTTINRTSTMSTANNLRVFINARLATGNNDRAADEISDEVNRVLSRIDNDERKQDEFMEVLDMLRTFDTAGTPDLIRVPIREFIDVYEHDDGADDEEE